MRTDLSRVRECFGGAAAWCGWSEADQAEIGAEIKAAIDSGDEALIASWAQHLEDLSGLAHLSVLCRAAETRIKAAAEEQRRTAA